MAGQHELRAVPVNSPVGPTACSKYINVLYAPFHPRNSGGASFPFFFFFFFSRVVAVGRGFSGLTATVSEPVSLCLVFTGTAHVFNLGDKTQLRHCFLSTSSAEFVTQFYFKEKAPHIPDE